MQDVRYAIGRSAAWANRAFETMQQHEDLMDGEQLRSLRETLMFESSRMARARMGMVSPDLEVWSRVLCWLDARIDERSGT
jgi:hypothetical protein